MFKVRLRELREAAGYKTQQSFADVFGVAQSTVGNWEAGKREPNYETTLKLANFFHVSVDYLLGQEGAEVPAMESTHKLPHAKYREVLAEGGMRLLMDADAKVPEEHVEEIVEFIKMKQRKYGR